MEFDKVFRALGDKHRLKIMDLLMERERNAGELLEQVDVVQSTLSHHMKSLCEAGLVTVRKEKKWTYYAVCASAAEEAREYLKRYSAGGILTPKTKETGEAAAEQKQLSEAGVPTIYASMKPSGKKKDEKEKKDAEKKKSGGKKKAKKNEKKNEKKKAKNKTKEMTENGESKRN